MGVFESSCSSAGTRYFRKAGIFTFFNFSIDITLTSLKTELFVLAEPSWYRNIGIKWLFITCCFIVSHLLEYSVMLLHYGCCIAYGTQCQSCQSVSRAPTGIWCTQHMAFWALRERPMHCLMTDQCRPSGLDQRALWCVLVREREIHRKIRSNLTVLNLTSTLKPVDTISRTAREEGKEKRSSSCS